MMEQRIKAWRSPPVVAAVLVWSLAMVVSAAAQETNGADSASSLPAVQAAPPSRPPMDPAVEPRLRQAMTLMQESQWGPAGEILRDLVQAFPGDPDVRRNYSLLLIQAEDPDAALVMLEPLLGTPYADFVVLNNAAWLYATHQDPQKRNSAKALELAQEALLLMPLNYHIWSTVAEAHYAGGQFDKALKASREAQRLATRAKAPAHETVDIVEQGNKIERAVAALALIE